MIPRRGRFRFLAVGAILVVLVTIVHAEFLQQAHVVGQAVLQLPTTAAGVVFIIRRLTIVGSTVSNREQLSTVAVVVVVGR